jgi:hypothetical protein
MREGGERRLRHDVAAKAVSVAQAERARALAEDDAVVGRAASLIFAIKIKGKDLRLSDELISEIAHKAVNDALKQITQMGL